MNEHRNLMLSIAAGFILIGGVYFFTRKKADAKVKYLGAKSNPNDGTKASGNSGMPSTRDAAIASILVLAKKGSPTIKDSETLKQLTPLSDAEIVAYNKMLNSMLNDAIVQELKEVKTDKVATEAILNKHGITDADLKLGAAALGKMMASSVKA